MTTEKVVKSPAAKLPEASKALILRPFNMACVFLRLFTRLELC